MSILDVFRSAPAAPTPAPEQVALPPVTDPATVTDPTLAAPATPTPAVESLTGLDAFNDLWENTPNPDGDLNPNPDFAVDQDKLMEAAGKVDFTQVVTPELMQKVNAGGEDAMQAMMQAMNLMSQATYAQSAAAATAITKAAYQRAEASMEQRIAAQITSTGVNDGVLTENPLLNHKAAQPIIAALNTQIATKFPNATSSERIAMAKQFLTDFADVAKPEKPAEPSQTPESMDWEKFLI